jgi:hypothetical protein
VRRKWQEQTQNRDVRKARKGALRLGLSIAMSDSEGSRKDEIRLTSVTLRSSDKGVIQALRGLAIELPLFETDSCSGGWDLRPANGAHTPTRLREREQLLPRTARSRRPGCRSES